MLKQPDRLPDDGSVRVECSGHNHSLVYIEVDGQNIMMSQYNAWRLFGMLALLLKIPLTRAVAKAIKF